jgi:hypothetical protein
MHPSSSAFCGAVRRACGAPCVGVRACRYRRLVSILFNETDTSTYIEHMPRHLLGSIDSEAEDYLLNTSETDLVAHYVSKYRLDVPELDNDGIYIRDRGEVVIDISGQPGRYFSTPGANYRKGTQITIAVPFSGDADLFKFHPSQFTSNPPRAEIGEGELRLVYSGLDQTSDQIKARYQGDVATISQWLVWLRDQIAPFNASLEQTVLSALTGTETEDPGQPQPCGKHWSSDQASRRRSHDLCGARCPTQGECDRTQANGNTKAIQP